ncbi:5825_t:CDS:2 [Entrophospora sp. SA101]|nr:5825_t:CDS:2 [Entrophospora sp. SA101]
MIKQNIIFTLLLSCILIQAFTQNQYCDNNSQYCISVDVPNTSAQTYATFRLEAPSTIGWMGIGIGDSMLDTWLRTDGKVALSQRVAKTYAVPTVTDRQADLELDPTSGIQTNNSSDGSSKLVVIFKRLVSVQDSTIASNFIWAVHTSNRPPDDPFTMEITEHSSHGNMALSSSPPISKRVLFLIIHGSLMFAAWAVAAPLGVFFARFGRNVLPKRWFSLHWGIQALLALPLTVIGFIMAFPSGASFTTRNSHHVIGMVILICLFVQLLIGGIHHHMYDPNRKSIPWWTKLHWWFGRCLVLLALVQISLGLDLYDVNPFLLDAYYVYAGSLVFIYLVMSFLFWNKRRNQIQKYGKSSFIYTGIKKQEDYEDEFDEIEN